MEYGELPVSDRTSVAGQQTCWIVKKLFKNLREVLKVEWILNVLVSEWNSCNVMILPRFLKIVAIPKCYFAETKFSKFVKTKNMLIQDFIQFIFCLIDILWYEEHILDSSIVFNTSSELLVAF